MKTITHLALAATLTLGSLACGDDTGPSIEETEFATSLNVDLAASTQTVSGLYYRDLVVGTGATATATSGVSLRYTGWFPNGNQFDSNIGASVPLEFRLGLGSAVPGFEEGIVGMKVGGQRQLIIPPSLAYGKAGYQNIPGNAILVFEIELIAVN